LVPVKALALLFRAKLRAALRQTDLYDQVAPDTWRQPWVVDCRTVGSGAAALKYLAPYICGWSRAAIGGVPAMEQSTERALEHIQEHIERRSYRFSPHDPL
jgi:hypothetical protein